MAGLGADCGQDMPVPVWVCTDLDTFLLLGVSAGLGLCWLALPLVSTAWRAQSIWKRVS